MRTLIIDSPASDDIFQIQDPEATDEKEFQIAVLRAITRGYPGYKAVGFTGGFRYEGRVFEPDLALVARDFSHWFVIEVELTSHSLDRHVLPQVRAFQYGEPEPDCARILARELGVAEGVASSLLTFVPRQVAVIANTFKAEWENALRALTIQLLTVSRFLSPSGLSAVEISGVFRVVKESLGFGRYRATDRSIRFAYRPDIPLGEVQILDHNGSISTWVATHEDNAIWMTKERGTPAIVDGVLVQLLRSYDGRLSINVPVPRF